MNTFTVAYNRSRGVHLVQRPIHESKLISFSEFCQKLDEGFKGEMFVKASFKQIGTLEQDHTINTYL